MPSIRSPAKDAASCEDCDWHTILLHEVFNEVKRPLSELSISLNRIEYRHIDWLSPAAAQIKTYGKLILPKPLIRPLFIRSNFSARTYGPSKQPRGHVCGISTTTASMLFLKERLFPTGGMCQRQVEDARAARLRSAAHDKRAKVVRRQEDTSRRDTRVGEKFYKFRKAF